MTNGVRLPWLVNLPEGPGFPMDGGDFRTIAWYREQWARERWKAFCNIWIAIGLLAARDEWSTWE